MSRSTATDTSGPLPTPTPAPAPGPGSGSGSGHSNEVVIAAIRAHHTELAEQLQARTAAVLGSARAGDCTADRDELHEWYRAVLLPHIVAEEQALYSPGVDLDATRLLICGMLAEHRALVSLIADLALARQAFDAATTAASAQALFSAHLSKENDLLLPALDAAGLDLAAVLDGLHDILGHSDPRPASADDGGCGCGHDTDVHSAQSTSVQITATPPGGVRADAGGAAVPNGHGELDVRALPHGQRHEIIFARLDTLSHGESLLIVNDHDPKPLRYQTSALWPGRFVWTYRESGPRVWRVAITRVG